MQSENVRTLELPKLPENSDGTNMWAWLSFFKARDEKDLEKIVEENKEIGEAADMLRKLSEDERMEMLEDARDKFLWDFYAACDDALEEGEAKATREVVKNAAGMGLSIENMMRLTGQSREKVEEILTQAGVSHLLQSN